MGQQGHEMSAKHTGSLYGYVTEWTGIDGGTLER